MNRALIQKYLAEAWLLWVAMALGVSIFCWFRVWVVGELDSAQFRQIIDLLPKDWRKFSTVDFDWLISYLGRTSLCLDEPMLSMLVVGWVMVRGSDVVSGELNRGSMEMLLAQPISRATVYWSHANCTLIGLLLLVALTWLAMSVGIWTTSVTETTYPTISLPFWQAPIPLRLLSPKIETVAMSSVVNPILFFPGVFKLFCLGLFFGGLAAFCSAFDRYRWRTLGFVAAFYFANAGIKLLSLASEKLSWLKYCNVFSFFSPANSIESAEHDFGSLFVWFARNSQGTVSGTGMLMDTAILCGLGLFLYYLGYLRFQRRDLPAPV
jgi:ABC-2 type transport system permease protein